MLSIPAGFCREVCYDAKEGVLFTVDMVRWERKQYVQGVVVLWRFESLYDSGKDLPEYYNDFIHSFQFPQEFLELCQKHSSE
ncbi:MAG: hypothetical protein ACPL07_02745 [Candidatus Bathyarchaeia archaeon]